MAVTTPNPAIEVPAPEPDLTPEMMIERARALRPALRENQARTEQLTHVTPEMFESFRDAGFYRAMQPRMFGGYQFSPRAWGEMLIEVSRGCSSSAWNLALASAHSLTIASRFSEEAQREIFGPDGDFRAPLPLTPTGMAVKRDDGYVVNGKWDWASGCTVSTHFLALSMIDDGDGHPYLGLICVPEGWEVLDNWGDTIGMRGSGSNSVVVHDAWIPDRYVVPGDMLNLDMESGTFGARLHDDPMYAGQALSTFNLTIVPVMVGNAWAALDAYEEILKSRTAPFPPPRLRREVPEHQRNYGMARALVDCAQRIVSSAADDFVAYARRGCEGGPQFSTLDDRTLSMSIREAGLMACRAVEMMADASGTSATRDGGQMQRHLRDALVYKSHINAQQGLWAADVGGRILESENHATTTVACAPSGTY